MSRPRILVVDDDREIRSLVADALADAGMQVSAAGSTAAAEDRLASQRIDLVLLDRMLPGESGVDFCRRLRTTSSVPVIMLTALGEEPDRVMGLEAGADDYLGKPFTARELIARIQAVLRRAPPARPGETHRLAPRYRFEGFVLDVEQRLLSRDDGAPIQLTSGEFALLHTLVEHRPRVLSRDQLLDMTRGASAGPFDRSIDAQISRLRRKLETETRRPRFIKT
ncbi:MAG: response regulator, partial [Pseudomonadales bacterium]|nr:response regulator [Pseudomonadales bacterium]